jgi:hypothetical protein
MDEVYQVPPRSFDPGLLSLQAYFPPRALAGQPYTAYIIALNPGGRSYALRPTDVLQVAVSWEGAEGRMTADVAADVPLVTSPDGGAAVIPLPLAAPVKSGVYHLSLVEEGGPLGAWLMTATVEVGEHRDDAFPVPAQLTAWTLPPVTRPGQPLQIGLVWRALGKIDAYYSIYVKLLDADGNEVAGWDGQPREGEAPTLLWLPGETIDDTVALAVPAGAPAGDYTVEAGMYRAVDLATCLTFDRDGALVDRLVLGTVRIEP